MNQKEREQIVKAWYKAQPEAEFEWCVCGQIKQYCICDVDTKNLPIIKDYGTVAKPIPSKSKRG